MNKKDYVTPSVEVVETGTRESLLIAGSSVNSTGSFAEDGDLNNFDDNWE